MYTIEYMSGMPATIRRSSDGFIIPLSRDGFALDEWQDFLTWNNAQTTPLDYTAPRLKKTEEVFLLPIRAPSITVDDIFVESRAIKDDPDEAMAEAMAESGKGKGNAKSLDLIARSSLKMIDKLQRQVAVLEKRLDKLDKAK